MFYIDPNLELRDFDGNPLYDKPETVADRKVVTLGYMIVTGLMQSFPANSGATMKIDENAEQKMDDFMLAMRFSPSKGGLPVDVDYKQKKRLIEVIDRLPFTKIFIAQALHMINTAPTAEQLAEGRTAAAAPSSLAAKQKPKANGAAANA
jgi:hypothetical protein